jgi:hypothetical protein
MDANPERKQCCGEFDLKKLGNCRQCVVSSTMIAILSWTAFFFIRQPGLYSWLSTGVLVYSLLLSLLVLAHGVSFISRRRQERRGERS